jgi:hypothetical protein
VRSHCSFNEQQCWLQVSVGWVYQAKQLFRAGDRVLACTLPHFGGKNSLQDRYCAAAAVTTS